MKSLQRHSFHRNVPTDSKGIDGEPSLCRNAPNAISGYRPFPTLCTDSASLNASCTTPLVALIVEARLTRILFLIVITNHVLRWLSCSSASGSSSKSTTSLGLWHRLLFFIG